MNAGYEVHHYSIFSKKM